MGDMNKIVTEHVRVSDLPEHVRRGMAEGGLVKVTVETEAAAAVDVPGYGFAKGFYAAQGIDPVEYIRQLRDEWDR
jgi:GTP-binding protein EngB required for normal cell division